MAKRDVIPKIMEQVEEWGEEIGIVDITYADQIELGERIYNMLIAEHLLRGGSNGEAND